ASETPGADRPNPRKAANFIFACMIVAGITFFITGVTLVALAGQRDPFDSKTSAMRFTGLPMIVLAFPLIVMGTLMCFCSTATVPPPAFST
ncbi:hypothetical protein LSAT2_023435, partial [Lamellibrachia satsuma]